MFGLGHGLGLSVLVRMCLRACACRNIVRESFNTRSTRKTYFVYGASLSY